MLMLKLSELTLLLNLVSCAKGEPWKITVESKFETVRGSDLTIPCTFTHPSDHQVEEIYWKTDGTSECSKKDNDKQAFVFHPKESCVLPNYKHKTRLIGDKTKGNCSLVILNVQENGNIYLRVSTDKNKYSYNKNPVNIHLDGTDTKLNDPKSGTASSEVTTSMPETTTISTSNENIYLGVCIPVIALLIIVIIGIIVFIKYKRSRALTRKESEYYVNFSRAASTAPKSETSCKKLDAEPPEEKAIDEPIYINLEAPTTEMSQSTNHTDSIYANMDYSI